MSPQRFREGKNFNTTLDGRKLLVHHGWLVISESGSSTVMTLRVMEELAMVILDGLSRFVQRSELVLGQPNNLSKKDRFHQLEEIQEEMKSTNEVEIDADKQYREKTSKL